VKEKYNEDDMKVLLKDKKILYVSKSISNDAANAESVGLALVKGEYTKIFKEYLEQLIRNKGYFKSYWLEVFNIMVKNKVIVQSFKIDGKNKWREVDFHPDLDEINKLLGLSRL
jgi:choline kinase